jgi:REP element-mobilizing transposase RayT
LAAIIQSFKSAATRAVNLARETPGSRLWQRGFYDHVIRDDEELNRLRGYIEQNSLRWALDRENPSRPSM